jgi:putative heme-binding domain-containing protein
MANDQWFRGIHLESGPAGSVYLSDWYDEQACHRSSPEAWDRTNGRLYRISYGDHRAVDVDLAALTEAELVRLQTHPNDWYARQARRLLQERGTSTEARRTLTAQVRAQMETGFRLRSLWTLHVSGGLDELLALALMDDAEPYLRGWAVQLTLEDGEASPTMLTKLADMARDDASPLVRRFLASGLQRLPLDQRWDIAAGLLTHGEDADDVNIPLILWYGIEPLMEEDPPRVLALGTTGQLEKVERFVYRRAAAGAENELDSLLNHMVAALGREEAQGSLQTMTEELAGALETRPGLTAPASWSLLSATLLADPDRDRHDLAARIALAFGDVAVAPEFRTLLMDSEADWDRRRAALAGLLHARDPDLAPTLLKLLSVNELRLDALRALATYDHPPTHGSLLRLLAAGDELNAEEQQAAVAVLTARASSAGVFLRAIQEGTLPKSHLDSAPVRQQLSFLNDASVDALVFELWGRSRPTSTSAEAELVRYRAVIEDTLLPPGDPSLGRALFDQSCASCHTLFGEGGDLGPDLTGSDRADMDYILRNMLDPSAEVGREYLATIVRTVDGRLISGLARERNEEAVVMDTQDERIVIPLSEIELDEWGEPIIVIQDISFMPSGQLEGLSDEEVRALVAYLASSVQVEAPE